MQYTLRNISQELDRTLRSKAKQQGKSLNRLAIELIERGVGLTGEPVIHHDMDDLFGSGALEPAVLKAIRKNDVVNAEDWR